MNFEVNLIFLDKPLFLQDQKFKTNIYKSWERGELLRWNKSISHHFYRAFNGANNTHFFRRWESDFNQLTVDFQNFQNTSRWLVLTCTHMFSIKMKPKRLINGLINPGKCWCRSCIFVKWRRKKIKYPN